MLSEIDKDQLKRYFENRADVAFAFLCGSTQKKSVTKSLNFIIAVYFCSEERHPPEYESDTIYKTEGQINSDLKQLLKSEVELLVLNRAISTVAADALRGTPTTINDQELYLDFILFITALAADFMEFKKSSNEKN